MGMNYTKCFLPSSPSKIQSQTLHQQQQTTPPVTNYSPTEAIGNVTYNKVEREESLGKQSDQDREDLMNVFHFLGVQVNIPKLGYGQIIAFIKHEFGKNLFLIQMRDGRKFVIPIHQMTQMNTTVKDQNHNSPSFDDEFESIISFPPDFSDFGVACIEGLFDSSKQFDSKQKKQATRTGRYINKMSVADILSYSGSNLDIGLNYAALVTSTFPTILIFHGLPLDAKDSWRQYLWILIWIGLSIFQVGLCLIVLCSGISIIWSALDGLNIFLYYKFQILKHLYNARLDHSIQFTLGFSWLYSIALWIYYAVVEEALTTIAHLCALLLGLLLAYGLERFIFNKVVSTRREETESILRSEN